MNSSMDRNNFVRPTFVGFKIVDIGVASIDFVIKLSTFKSKFKASF